MSIETNLNQSPYFDDFNEDKNFYKVLFRPGYGVQARELTQVQSILQNQISKFANEIIVDGTIINGVGLTTDKVGFVKLKDVDENNRSVLISDFMNNNEVDELRVVGSTSGVSAELVDAEDGSEAGAPNYLTAFVSYNNSGANNTTKSFQDGEPLTFRYANNDIKFHATTITSNSSGDSLYGHVTDGVVFHKGHFVNVLPQSTIIGKYITNPTKKVGFRTIETIVNSNEDSSLLDNSTGSTNYSAPGANRLKLSAELVVEDISANTENFFTIANIKDGNIEQINTQTVYSDIGDYIAERFFDTNGNYVTDPFDIRIREHLKKARSLGRYSASEGGLNDKLVAEIEKGRGYVQGHQIELVGSKYIDIDKGVNFETENTVVVGQAYGNYIVVNELCGPFDFTTLATFDLKDTAQVAISTGRFSESIVRGLSIGSAKIRGVQHESGESGTPGAKYRIYLCDIRMNSGKSFAEVRSIQSNTTSLGSNLVSAADLILENGNAKLKETNLNTLVFPTGIRGIKTLKNENNQNNAQFVVRKRLNAVNISTNGTGTISIENVAPGGNENLNDTGAPLTNTDERNFIIISKTETRGPFNPGRIVSFTDVGQINGDAACQFRTSYKVGDSVSFTPSSGVNIHGIITQILSDRIMRIASEFNIPSSVFSNQSVQHATHYPIGYVWDLDANGSITRTRNTATLNLNRGVLQSSFTAEIYYDVLRTIANPAKKTVFKNRYIQINTHTHTKRGNGPWPLGVSDAFELVSVFDGTNDVTNNFILDTGMKDDIYDNSFLRLKEISEYDTTNKELTVKFHYFGRDVSSGYGFLTKDSYIDIIDDVNPNSDTRITTQEIPVFTSPSTGRKFDLRDSIDFRPKRTNNDIEPHTASTGFATGQINPGESVAFDYDSNYGVYTPSPDKNFQSSVQYYLPRKDLIVVNKEGSFEAVRGVPNITPKSPSPPKNSMVLGTIDIPAYPSLSPFVAKSYNRLDYQVQMRLENNRRYTMGDIRTLDDRIKNVEYYSSLNALETAASNKQIFNSAGMSRFKNGFFVDNFNGHQNADTSNPNYRAAIDINNNYLRPSFVRNDIPFGKDVSLTSTNIVQTGDLITLPYENEELIGQNFASKLRNPVQELLFNWEGECILSPESDNLESITTLPDIQIDFNGVNRAFQQLASITGLTSGLQFGSWNRVSGINEQRIVTSTNIDSSVDNIDLGNIVSEVSLRDYMRTIDIQVQAVRMKPNTRVYAYFDDERVSEYCTPCNSSFVATGDAGDSIVTDNEGSAYLIFRIPNDANLQFRTGTKQFKLQDIENPETESELVTTSATGLFTSSPIDIVQKGTSVNLVVPQISSSSRVQRRTLTRAVQQDRSRDPIAQSFEVNVSDSDGIWITKIDLFFGNKSANLPVTLQIREMLNGYPTNTIVPYGSKTLSAASVNVSADSSAVTSFTFDSPVFLENNKSYSMVIIPGGNSDDYTLWTGELGGIDQIRNILISKQPSTGILFTSANDSTWSPIMSEDLKFVIHRAKFDTTVTGTIHIENQDVDFLTIDSNSSRFITGETVRGESSLVISNNATISVGDNLTDHVANGTVRSIGPTNNSRTLLKIDAQRDFRPSANVFLNSSATPIGNVFSFSSADVGTGKVIFQNEDNTKINITESNGSLSANTFIRGQSSGEYARVDSVDDLEYSLVVPKFPELKYSGTNSLWQARTTSTSGIIDANYVAIDLGADNDLRDNKKIYSKSNESPLTAVNGSKKTIAYRGVFSTNNDKLSPVVDASRLNSITVRNIINDNRDNEDKSVGDSLVRYITKPITLADGQDAEDLIVYLSAYKPLGTNIDVYARVLNGEDNGNFIDKDFSPLKQVTTSNTHSIEISEPLDFKEYEYTFGANTSSSFLSSSANNHAMLNSANNDVVAYRSESGEIFQTYKTFAIKVVMTSDDEGVIPLAKDMRAIALQK